MLIKALTYLNDREDNHKGKNELLTYLSWEVGLPEW